MKSKAVKDKQVRKWTIREWSNIDDIHERSTAAWEDFKQNPHIKNIMKRSMSWDTYDELRRVCHYTHEEACDSVITNIADTPEIIGQLG